jgi:hypothetical protein
MWQSGRIAACLAGSVTILNVHPVGSNGVTAVEIVARWLDEEAQASEHVG